MERFDRLGLVLRLLRERRGHPQAEIAARAKITSAMLSNYESGRSSPSLRVFGRVLDALDIDLGELDDALDFVNERAPRGGAQRLYSPIRLKLEGAPREIREAVAEASNGLRRLATYVLRGGSASGEQPEETASGGRKPR
jgi:transcriptional regulator with XRE-family HTH domain